MMPDDTLARVVHDIRREFGAAYERPVKPAPWEERHPRQQELDRQIAAARDALREAAGMVLRGHQGQERSDEKGA